MSISMMSDSYAGKITVDAEGKPNGVADVEKSLVKGVLAKVTSNFDGGKSFATGLGHTLGVVAEQWIGATARNLVYGDTRVRLNAWSAS